MEVVRLGALCELESTTPQQANFRVSEYAVLDDGSEVVLHSARGYTSSAAWSDDGQVAEDVWEHMTAERIRSSVMTVVLPDDAEETGEEHHWDWLMSLLAGLGVLTGVDDLRAVPYDVRLGPEVISRLENDDRTP